MFSKGRKITINIEIVYKEVISNTVVKGKKKSRTLLRLKSFRELLT